MSNWRLVHRDIRQYALYNPDNPAVDGLLHDMATQKISEIGKTKQNHLKFTVMFAQNIECGYMLEPPRQGGSNEYPHSMFDGLLQDMSTQMISEIGSHCENIPMKSTDFSNIYY